MQLRLFSIAEGDINSSDQSVKAISTPNRSLEVAIANLQEYCNGWFFPQILVNFTFLFIKNVL